MGESAKNKCLLSYSTKIGPKIDKILLLRQFFKEKDREKVQSLP